MRQFSLWSVVVLLGMIALIVFGMSSYNESAANKYYAQGQARSMIIEAQSQARLDSAQANAVNLATMLPYVVLGVVVVFGSAGLVLAVVILRQQPGGVTRIERIERVILLSPGQSRHQMWQTLSDSVERPVMIEAGK